MTCETVVVGAELSRITATYFFAELCPKVVRGELEKKSGVSGLTCK